MQQSESKRSELPWFDLFMSVLLVSFLAVGLITGYLFYQTIRHFVATNSVPILPHLPTIPRISLAAPEVRQQDEGITALPTAPVPVVVDDPVEPVPAMNRPMTVLVMGVDKRQGERGPWRTDTMILARIDPVEKTAAMVSLPRDLFLLIPDYGRGARAARINTANVYGDIYDYPGGGPALAKRTIYRNFGIQVDRYAIIDFDGFRKIVDQIGGIEVDVPRRIVDTQYPTEDYGYMRVEFAPGIQHMDGKRALIYARTRKSSSDFARAERQQQVIMAIRDKALSLGILPSLTPANLVSMINTVDDSIETDLTVEELLALARVGREIQEEDIARAVIGPNQIRPITNSDGSEVLLPRWERVIPLLEDTLGIDISNGAPTIPIPPTPTPAATPTADGGEQPHEVTVGQ